LFAGTTGGTGKDGDKIPAQYEPSVGMINRLEKLEVAKPLGHRNLINKNRRLTKVRYIYTWAILIKQHAMETYGGVKV
jgi:hypothetical protein